MLGGPLSGGGKKLTHHERQRREHQSNLRQCDQQIPRREACGAQHGNLRVASKDRKGIKSPDQNADRKQFIQSSRQRQSHITQCMLQLIPALAYAFKLVDQVKEGEQHQERRQYQGSGRIDLPCQMALIEFQRHRTLPQASGFCRR